MFRDFVSRDSRANTAVPIGHDGAARAPVIAHRRGSFVRFDHRLFAVRTSHPTSCANVACETLGVLNDGSIYRTVDSSKRDALGLTDAWVSLRWRSANSSLTRPAATGRGRRRPHCNLGGFGNCVIILIVDTLKDRNGSIRFPDLPLGPAGAAPVQYTDDSAPIVFDFSLSGIEALQARKATSRWLETVESMSQRDPLAGSGDRTYNGILYNWLTLFRNALNCATV